MSIEGNHVRNETKTRERYKLLPEGEKEAPEMGSRCIAWCGENASSTWFFQSTDHVLLHLQQGGGIKPCKNCLGTILALVSVELGKPGEPPA